ncbi:MAG: nicotinate-nucleotide adenylyltransferase [Dehalococcoidia bacterium]|nr:nicotinate-nucleotide adenylyltransferase [Dehalococcoidia bacterium]
MSGCGKAVNIAVFGGTFDPIHNGHLMVADVVASRLSAHVIFVPAGQPWLKAERQLASAGDRLEMVHRAISGDSRYSLSTVETERSGPSYTIDTIRQLKQRLGLCEELYFVLGWDVLFDLPSWHEPEALIQMCRLVAVPRIGCNAPDAADLEKLLAGLSQRVVLLDKPVINISSSVIREKIKQGLSLENLLPQKVEDYIKEKGLYLHD